jgi:hypothetical protein
VVLLPTRPLGLWQLLFSSAASAVVVLTASASPALAAPFDPHGENWEGLSQFVAMAEAEIGKDRVVVAPVLDLHALLPADALFIVHPERPIDGDELSTFMRAGGRIVLLDDYGSGDGLEAQFGIRRRPLPRRPVEMLRGNPALAIAEPAGDHPVVHNVARVVTNHATGLEHPDLSPVLVVRGDGEPDVLLSVAGSVGRGRLLAVGDASIAINGMLRYPGNRALSLALVRYALEDDAWGKRAGKLYVLTNDFDTTGTFGDSSVAWATATGARRALVRRVEELQRNGPPPLVVYCAALALALGVLAWTVTRAGKMHKASMPRFAREVPVVAQGGVAGHAAVLGAPGTARGLAVLELKSALEEELATKLGLERAPSHEQIVAKVRDEHLLSEDDTDALARLFASLTRIEALVATGRGRRRGALERMRDAEVIAVADQVKRLLAAVDSARRDTLARAP